MIMETIRMMEKPYDFNNDDDRRFITHSITKSKYVSG